MNGSLYSASQSIEDCHLLIQGKKWHACRSGNRVGRFIKLKITKFLNVEVTYICITTIGKFSEI